MPQKQPKELTGAAEKIALSFIVGSLTIFYIVLIIYVLPWIINTQNPILIIFSYIFLGFYGLLMLLMIISFFLQFLAKEK